MVFMSTIDLSKNSQYFIGIGKQDIHSFIFLGVLHKGSPQLLLRAGKTDDISRCVLNNLARLADEGLSRNKARCVSINYQAFSINYQQVIDFLRLIAQIEIEQLKIQDICSGIIRCHKKDHNLPYESTDEQNKEFIEQSGRIRCYVPTKENGDTVTFTLQKLIEANVVNDTQISAENMPIIIDARKFNITSTCRTTALKIVEVILGFATNISKCFFISPKYETSFIGGIPDKEAFYILPPPPSAYKEGVSNIQLKVLNKLYERLEKIPQLNTRSIGTRLKFDALKSTYQDMVGKNHLTAEALLCSLSGHEDRERAALFTPRSPSMFSRLCSLPSSTEKMFCRLKEDLRIQP